MSYFEDYADRLRLTMKKARDLPGLRECQLGAYWAGCAHFTASDAPALVVMPTGSGKTAVMILLAFGLRASRVLVVTPAVVLRDQTARKFARLDDLVREGIVAGNTRRPDVYVQEGRVTSTAMWNALASHDVIVATPHTISAEYHPEIAAPPLDLFDLVLFDEAHHAPARTWHQLLEAFRGSKRLLLTATPFRQDKRRLPGQIVYEYPLGRAIDQGIYQTIDYHPVSVTATEEKDGRLCEAAASLLEAERALGRRPKLLVRTGTVRKCEHLVHLYSALGIAVDRVNYDRTMQSNRAVIDAVENDQLDGIVCVGMLGEGLDLPELKMAVFHDPPQSLPFTLQFIGRISRPLRDQVAQAHVVACPDDVTGEMRKLYRQDARWRDLVPQLVDEAVGRVSELRQFHPAGAGGGYLDIDPREIYPFFSSRLYSVRRDRFDLSTEVKAKRGWEIAFSEHLDEGNLLLLVTERHRNPPWCSSVQLSAVVYDLHIYYHHRASQTLFEYTTADAVAGQIRRQILGDDANRHLGPEVMTVLRDGHSVGYLMVGLANVLGQSPSLPTYKTLMGRQVQGAVRPTDGRAFTVGHALAKVSPGETRGIGTFQGRVWSIRRSTVLDYKRWCDAIGAELLLQRPKTLPGMEFLPSPEAIEELPSKPIAVGFNYEALGYHLEISSGQEGLPPTGCIMADPEFELTKRGSSLDRLSLSLWPSSQSRPIAVEYDVGSNRWHVGGLARHIVKVDTGYAVQKLPLDDFLERYPPFIYLGGGGVLVGGQFYRPSAALADLPEECTQTGLDWGISDITVEATQESKGIIPAPGKVSVQDWVERRVRQDSSRDALILKDHGKGEIADFVVVEPRDKTISLYHCKASRCERPGARIDDLRDVAGQVLCSLNWLRRSDFLQEILARATGATRPSSRLVKGGAEIGEQLADDFQPSAWQYRVVIVQPGLDCRKAVASVKTRTLLINCYEWLSNAGASLLLMGQ